MDEEGLREVALDTDDLVVDVMVVCIVPEQRLQGIEGQAVPAMIVDGFEGRESEEERCLADGHETDGLGESGTDAVEEEAFERVVVESAEGVRHVKSVMCLVELLVKPLVYVEQAVEEVLPGVDNEAALHTVSAETKVKFGEHSQCETQLRKRDGPPVEE